MKIENNIFLVPTLARDMKSHAIDDIEINPCTSWTEGNETFVEQCEPKDAQFWSVYVHYEGGGLDCIADCETEEQANKVKEFLLELITRFKKS